jgi:hypothetical protein
LFFPNPIYTPQYGFGGVDCYLKLTHLQYSPTPIELGYSYELESLSGLELTPYKSGYPQIAWQASCIKFPIEGSLFMGYI